MEVSFSKAQYGQITQTDSQLFFKNESVKSTIWKKCGVVLREMVKNDISQLFFGPVITT